MGKFERQVSKSIGHYSTDEINTKQRWIDGKPIYRKVVDLGTLPNNTTATVAHGISSFDTMLPFRGRAYNGSRTINLPHADTTAVGIVEIWVDATNINIDINQDYTQYDDAHLILEYTK